MQEKIQAIQSEYLEKIAQAGSLKALDELFLELFGKNGQITLLPKEFPNLDKAELQKIAPLFNQAKGELEKAINDRRQEIREEGYRKIEEEELSLEQLMDPRVELEDDRGELQDDHRLGYLHPLTVFRKQIVDLFSKIGFSQFEAPQIDSDHYNFEVLNIPQGHPARDLWDTLFIDKANLQNEKDTLLLKTHTSNAQVRIMEQFKPPFRMMVLDRCFRYENLDARHEHTFDQFEIVLVGKGISMTNLQYLSEYYFKAILGEDTEVRMRPKTYPFVEPTAGIDALCIFCKGKGCRVCGEGWIELAGAGMIHPTVLKNGGIDPNEYSGIAWGTGLERFLMLLYGIEDVREFRSGDLKFLQSFEKDKV